MTVKELITFICTRSIILLITWSGLMCNANGNLDFSTWSFANWIGLILFVIFIFSISYLIIVDKTYKEKEDGKERKA